MLQTHLLRYCFQVILCRYSLSSQMIYCALSTWETQLNWLFLLFHKILVDLLHFGLGRAEHSLFSAKTVPQAWLSHKLDLTIDLCTCTQMHLCVWGGLWGTMRFTHLHPWCWQTEERELLGRVRADSRSQRKLGLNPASVNETLDDMFTLRI